MWRCFLEVASSFARSGQAMSAGSLGSSEAVPLLTYVVRLSLGVVERPAPSSQGHEVLSTTARSQGHAGAGTTIEGRVVVRVGAGGAVACHSELR